MRTRRVVAATLLLVAPVAACTGPEETMPACRAGNRLGIMAQAVPAASYIPCVEALPTGWNFATLDVDDGRARFWLNHDREGLRVAEIGLTPTCDVRGASDERATGPVARFVRYRATSPTFAGTAYDVFEGGCVTYHFAFERDESRAHIELQNQLFTAIDLLPRAELAEEVRRDLGRELGP